MKKMKFLSKRGVAMEMALVTMLVLFGLSMVLLTVAELGNVLNRRILTDATGRIGVSRIGDTFVRNCKSGDYDLFDTDSDDYEDYLIVKEDLSDESAERYALTITSKEHSKTLLYVVCDGDGNILRWTNYAPDIEETTPTDPVATGD